MNNLTDNQLNRAITEKLYPNQSKSWHEGFARADNFNFNNWNHLLNEIEKLGVDYSVVEIAMGWEVELCHSDNGWKSKAESQKRALAECLLKLLTTKGE